ncbi:hypothetical protein [Streptomyces sp. NPDC013489]|uniref:hypothetical protein n=1 Tax=Streptomyces sp. NPDC013489 TaxID=3155606 RepID=UPI0033E0AF9C
MDAVEKWQNPDGYWTPELSAAVDECQAGTRSTIPCPVCGTESTGMSVDNIFPEFHVPGRAPTRGVTTGRLLTLDPCMHALRQ